MKLRARSIRRWVLAIAGIAVLLLVGLRLRLKWELHHELTELRRAGLPTNGRELSEFYGRIPESSNAAPLLTNAYALFVESEYPTKEKLPVLGSIRPPPIDHPWPEEIDKVTGAFLDRNRAALAATLKAAECPDYRYYRDFADHSGPVESAQSHLGTLRKLLSLASLYAAQQGDYERAWQLASAEISVASFLRSEPSALGHMIYWAEIYSSLNDVERLISLEQFNASQLLGIRKAIAQVTDRNSLSRAIAGERANFLSLFYWQGQKLRFDQLDMPAMLENVALGKKPSWIHSVWEDAKVMAYRMSGLQDQDVLYYLQQSRLVEEAASSSLRDVQKLADDWESRLPYNRKIHFHYWSALGLEPYKPILTKVVAYHGRLIAADAALAVAQYRLQHEGRMPDSLDELVPEYLDVVPLEPKTGKPFALIKTADGFGIGRGTPVFKVRLNAARREPPATE